MGFFSLHYHGHTAQLIFDRPPVNALSLTVLAELGELLDQIELSKKARVVIITASGEKFFAAGADIKGLQDADVAEGRKINKLFQDTFDKVANLSIPTICGINGLALGGGTELAIACDIRVAAEHAQFSLPEANLGLIPGGGGTQRLPRLISLGKAKDILFTGRRVSAQEALGIHLVEYVVPQHDLDRFTLDLAKTIGEKSPNAIKALKKAINRGIETDLSEGLEIELDVSSELFSGEDFRTGITAFLKKEKPSF